MKEMFQMVCPCLLGMEGAVAAELKSMDIQNVEAQNGRVLFSGDAATLIRANLWSRFGERILILLGDFQAETFEELFQGVKALAWENFIGKKNAFPVKGRSLNSKLHSVPDCQAIIKKAIVERLKQKYHVTWFEETDAVCQVQFLIMKNHVSLMLDTSGAGLHKRGYRAQSIAAPIKETLAAGMAYFARLRPDHLLVDPFCGSGTILIEAAMYAMNIAPGMNRRFSAEKWDWIPKDAWQTERERARNLVRRDVPFQARGYDLDAKAAALTLTNAKKAGVPDKISVKVQDIRDFSADDKQGVIICNPPYGERLLEIKEARELYRALGGVFSKLPGWRCAVISPDAEFEACFGRKADKRRKLYNGMIPCQLYMYLKL